MNHLTDLFVSLKAYLRASHQGVYIKSITVEIGTEPDGLPEIKVVRVERLKTDKILDTSLGVINERQEKNTGVS